MLLQSEYKVLSDHCKNYAVELLDLCRCTEEILAMVNENGEVIQVYDGNDASANSLARVKLALKYEQKRVRMSNNLTGVCKYELKRVRTLSCCLFSKAPIVPGP